MQSVEASTTTFIAGWAALIAPTIPGPSVSKVVPSNSTTFESKSFCTVSRSLGSAMTRTSQPSHPSFFTCAWAESWFWLSRMTRRSWAFTLSSSTRVGLTEAIQPWPHGSFNSGVGSLSSAAFTATTTPERGAGTACGAAWPATVTAASGSPWYTTSPIRGRHTDSILLTPGRTIKAPTRRRPRRRLDTRHRGRNEIRWSVTESRRRTSPARRPRHPHRDAASGARPGKSPRA